MMKLRVIAFFAASSLCGFLFAGALPDLPPLPSLPGASAPSAPLKSSAVLPDVASATTSSSDGRTNIVDTAMLDAQGKDLGGSWFKKRHWTLKAREQQEKANSLVSEIQAQGLPLYDSKRALFSKDVVAFYDKIGMDRGKVDALLDELSPYFYPGGAEAGNQLVTKGTSYLNTSKKFQDYFDATLKVAQLKADLQAIADLDAAVSDRVSLFEKTCQQAVQKAAEAQAVINDMFALLNHDAARDSYYKLEGIVGYLEAVLKFVKTDLSSDLDRVIGLAKSRMSDVSKVVATARDACEKIKKDAETLEPNVDQATEASKPTHRDDEKKDDLQEAKSLDGATEKGREKTDEPLDWWGRIRKFLMTFI